MPSLTCSDISLGFIFKITVKSYFFKKPNFLSVTCSNNFEPLETGGPCMKVQLLNSYWKKEKILKNHL